MTEGSSHMSSAAGAPPPEVDQLWDQLRQKDAQILMLQKKLSHFRTWVSSIHSKVQQMNPQAIKNSKRLYIGGLPQDISEDELRHFMNGLMMKTGALTSPGSALVSCRITPEKNYAFVEFRSVEEASNCMAFDGVAYKDTYLKIRRPSNYDVSTAIMLGPVQPDPTMDTSQLDICRTVVEDSPNKLFVGGLPCDWSEEQVKELLLPYGSLKSFNLVMDKSTGKSKGYAFCEFGDESVTDYTVRSLHGRKVGCKMLTVKRALEGAASKGASSAGGGGGGSSGQQGNISLASLSPSSGASSGSQAQPSSPNVSSSGAAGSQQVAAYVSGPSSGRSSSGFSPSTPPRLTAVRPGGADFAPPALPSASSGQHSAPADFNMRGCLTGNLW